MTSQANADILEIDPNQLGKSVAANQALEALDQMLGSIMVATPAAPSLTLTSGGTTDTLSTGAMTSPYTIPYDASADEPLGRKYPLRFFKLVVAGALTANWSALFPASKGKFFLVSNQTSGGHNVIVRVGTNPGVTIPPGNTNFVFLNGSDVENIFGVSTAGIGDAPNDGHIYGRQSLAWTNIDGLLNISTETVIGSGTSTTLTTLSGWDYLIWRSASAGTKNSNIPAASSVMALRKVTIKACMGDGSMHSIIPVSGTIEGEASLEFMDVPATFHTSLTIFNDYANNDWLVQ